MKEWMPSYGFEVKSIRALQDLLGYSQALRVDGYLVFWFRKGRGEVFVDFQSINIQEDMLLFLNKGTLFRFGTTDAGEGEVIAFTENFFCRNEADRAKLHAASLFCKFFSYAQLSASLPAEQGRLVQSLWHWMLVEFGQLDGKASTELLQSMLNSFLIALERNYPRAREREANVSTELSIASLFKEFLEQDYATQKKFAIIPGVYLSLRKSYTTLLRKYWESFLRK